VEAVVRRLSNQESTLLANLAVGFLSGGLAGALVGYVLQRVGRVSCVVSEWETEFFEGFREKKRASPEEAGYFEFGIFLDFFNTKAIDTGIRGLCVLARSEDGEVIGASDLRTSKGARAMSDSGRVTSVSLPANSLTSMKVFGSGNKVLARHVVKGGRIEVFGYFPNKKEFSQPIDPRRDSWSPIAPLDVRERGRDG
jgi:hypothetical protein